MKKKSLPIVCAAFLIIAMTIQFIVSYRHEKADLMRQMDYKMELAQKDFLFEIYDMHEATDEIAQFFTEFNTGTEDLCALLQTVLYDYPDLYCCYLTFLPECSPNPGQWCSPTAFRVTADSVIAYDAKDCIPYKQRDWYTGALKNEKNEGHWSLPYKDGTHEDLVFTYSQQVYDEQDQLVAIAGADYTLAWTARLLEEVKPYDDAVCQLFSTDGTLIVGSGDATKVRDRIMFEKTLSPTDMRLVISVPKSHIRRSITGISLITLAVLLSGILILGLLLRHIKQEQDAFTRVETANKLMEKEMQIAHGIQMGILKGNSLKAQGERAELQLDARLIPIREVGGDLYDYYHEADKLWFIIGDVSGKGVPAAMFMSAAVNLFRAARGRAHSPRQIMEEMNSVLSENNPSMTFVTAIIGCLNISTGELIYCNAGHCAPLIYSPVTRNPSPLTLTPNIPIGYDGSFQFTEQRAHLNPGNTLVLYTDGITEARNEQRTMLGMKRWADIVESGKWNVDRLLNDVQAFMGEAEQADDVTLMTIHLTKKA